MLDVVNLLPILSIDALRTLLQSRRVQHGSVIKADVCDCASTVPRGQLAQCDTLGLLLDVGDEVDLPHSGISEEVGRGDLEPKNELQLLGV
jgi:hypothetical protein